MPADPEDGPALRRDLEADRDRLMAELSALRSRFAAFKRILIRHVEATGNARQSEELMALYEEAMR